MNILKLSILTFSVLLSGNAFSQSPQKNEGIQRILCKNEVDKREIFYDSKKAAWCDTTITDFCSLNRKNAIKKVCTRVYASRLAQLEKNDESESIATPEVDSETQKSQKFVDLEQEQMDIELKQIEIEQRKLDLRKKEMELLKQNK